MPCSERLVRLCFSASRGCFQGHSKGGPGSRWAAEQGGGAGCHSAAVSAAVPQQFRSSSAAVPQQLRSCSEAAPQLAPQQLRSCSAAAPQLLRSCSAAAPQSLHVISAVVPCYLRSRSVLLPPRARNRRGRVYSSIIATPLQGGRPERSGLLFLKLLVLFRVFRSNWLWNNRPKENGPRW